MTCNETDDQAVDGGGPGRRLRIALMGEFSAGKSTLSNLLLGSEPLPVRVTATSVPPVWISYGEEAITLIGFDGSEQRLQIDELTNAALENTKLVRLTLRSDILKLCDLMDMPGISDPNLAYDTWNEFIDEADCVIWCTHATQAWRQSEASSWEEIKDRTNGDNLLLVTQFDKLKTELDRTRVLARLGKETNGAFRAIFPVSLIQAIDAGDDEKAWRVSGADEFIRYLIDMLLSVTQLDDAVAESLFSEETVPENDQKPENDMHADPGESLDDLLGTDATSGPADDCDDPKVLPKRVAAKPGAQQRTRPTGPVPSAADYLGQAEETAHGE